MRNERTASSGSDSPTENAAQAIRTGARAASKASSDVRKNINHWRKTVVREAQERPGRTIAIALGAGYLLGGGLFSALTARILGTGVRVGMRLALIPLVTQGVASLTGDLFGGQDEDDDGGDMAPGRTETRNGRRHAAEQKETNP